MDEKIQYTTPENWDGVQEEYYFVMADITYLVNHSSNTVQNIATKGILAGFTFENMPLNKVGKYCMPYKYCISKKEYDRWESLSKVFGCNRKIQPGEAVIAHHDSDRLFLMKNGENSYLSTSGAEYIPANLSGIKSFHRDVTYGELAEYLTQHRNCACYDNNDNWLQCPSFKFEQQRERLPEGYMLAVYFDDTWVKFPIDLVAEDFDFMKPDWQFT